MSRLILVFILGFLSFKVSADCIHYAWYNLGMYDTQADGDSRCSGSYYGKPGQMFCDPVATKTSATAWSSNTGKVMYCGGVEVPFSCPAPTTRDVLSGNCVMPIPDYLAKGTPVDCLGGSTVYVPMSCPVDQQLKYFKSPAPGQEQICMDGTSVTYPNSCFLRDFLDNALLASTKVKNTVFKAAGSVFDTFSSPTAPKPKLLNEIEYVNKATGEMKWATLETSASKGAVSDAFSSFVKANPTHPMVQTVNTVTSGAYALDVTSGQLRDLKAPSDSRLLSPNETFEVLSSPTFRGQLSTALDIKSLAPYVDPNFVPIAPSVLSWIEGEFSRVTEKDPLNQPRATLVNPSPTITSVPINLSDTNPLPETTVPFAIPNPLVNPYADLNKPIIQPSISTTTTPQTTTTAITNPATSTTPQTTTTTTPQTTTTTNYGEPPPPTKYDNDWKLFEPFLTDALPSFNDPGNWLPQLPPGNCTYEVHTKIFGRNFDLAPCVPLTPLRVILSWAFSVLTAWLVFRLVFKSTA